MYSDVFEKHFIMPYETAEFLKRKFGFKEVNCFGPFSDNRLRIQVTYDSFKWKELIVECEGNEYIEMAFIRAFNTNKWDGTYIQDINTTVVKEILEAFSLLDCYELDKNMLLTQDEFEEIVDLSTVYGLKYEIVKEEDYDGIVLKLATCEGIYEIREDGYTFTERKTA
ncbi:MAG: hypothetical protein LBR68_05960 [Lachnoclostridium sp.]|jgi:hypothetical protein|nr:hypothetical protein [Lachnoclostridium sp.]